MHIGRKEEADIRNPGKLESSQPLIRQQPSSHRKTICTKGMPQILRVLGISDVCMDIDVQGCGTALGFGIRFASQAPGSVYLFDQQIVRP